MEERASLFCVALTLLRLADGWGLFPDAGFIETAGPFFYRLEDGQPSLCFPVLDKHENRNGCCKAAR